MENLNLNRRSLLQSLAAVMLGSAVTDHFISNVVSDQDPSIPIHIPAAGGKHGKIGDGNIAFKFTKSQTAGHLGVTENELPVGFLGAPPHFHKNFDEICRVTQGVLTIMVGEQLFQVKAGDWHLRPRGIVHSFWNTGKETAKFIELFIPGGHEAYMSALADLFSNGQRPKPGDLDKLAQRFDITFDWPKLKLVMDKYKVHL